MIKPLFIPLNRQYFEDFKAGRKHVEYCQVDIQFTLNNCTPGREVTLSLNYGTRNRLHGTVSRAWVKHYERPTGAIADCYGTEPVDIIAIEIQLNYKAKCGDRFTASCWFSYLTRTKLLGKCKIMRKGTAIVIEGLTNTQKQLLDCITWVIGPTDGAVERARQLAGIPVIIHPVIPGLESWANPVEVWAC